MKKNIRSKHIVGAVLEWEKRKGIDVFIELTQRLDSEK